MAAVALWSILLKPGVSQTIIPQADLRITNAALGGRIEKVGTRSSVQITYDKFQEEEEIEVKNTILCSLTPGSIEQSALDVVLPEEDEYEFLNLGPNEIYLTGNYIDQGIPGDDTFDDDDDDDDDDDFDLREVSSDVAFDPKDLDDLDTDGSRFEEIVDEPAPQSLKRPRDSDVTGDDLADGAAGVPKKLSKSEKRKLKKLKAEGGQAVPAPGGAQTTKDAKQKEQSSSAAGASKVQTEKKGPKDGAEDKKKAVEPKKKGEKGGADGKDKGKKPSGEEKTSADGSDKPSKSGAKDLPGGLKIQDIKIGAGPQAKKGSTVSMRYIGKLQNGNLFDKNVKGAPFTFHLGKGEVIKGWDEGVVGMQVGGERVLVIPPELAYGKKASKEIPANSTLKFEIKLLEIK